MDWSRFIILSPERRDETALSAAQPEERQMSFDSLGDLNWLAVIVGAAIYSIWH
jgi:hypothetical protein